MNSWEFRPVPFKFQLSDRTLFSVSVPMQVRSYGLVDDVAPLTETQPPSDALVQGSQGFSLRSVPITASLPVISQVKNYIRYVPLQYRHYYIDMRQSFEDYKARFSSKTRSTINRKVKKYARENGGKIAYKHYQTPAEMQEFFPLARQVSGKTYQEKLLDAGLPNDDKFLDHLVQLAKEDNVRAYILFQDAQPISYLCCPAKDDVLVYAYQGYDPDYMKLSVGTVLQWLALEQLFDEGRFKIFDFTEGESEHKRTFATHDLRCANMFFLKRTLRNRLLIRLHAMVNRLFEVTGSLLERWGLKGKIKKLLRFGYR